MASPVKVSDRLLALAKDQAKTTNRSATAQIEHWATLGRAVETLLGHEDLLRLKRAGGALPAPPSVREEEVTALLARLLEDRGREEIRARVAATNATLYEADPDDPDGLVEVRSDGTRRRGRLRGRRFVPTRPEDSEAQE